MEFRTALSPTPSTNKIQPSHRLVSIGSCFASHTGDRFQDMKMDILNNPFGTIFNPFSLFQLISKSIFDEPLDEDHYLDQKYHYFHYDVHSDFHSDSIVGLKNQLSATQEQFKAYLSNAKFLFITLGTAWVYRLNDTGKIVANCHKIPNHQFTKELLSVDDILDIANPVISYLQEQNPALQIVVTVSPVRHVKDGIPENMLSKSTLRLAAEALQKSSEQVHYFPSYEIMLDDLRDYRFYSHDMLHPNYTAIEYIWEFFKTTYFSDQMCTYCDKWQAIKRDLAHKVMNPGTTEHLQFLESTLKKLHNFSVLADVSQEIEKVEKELAHYGQS